MTNVIAILHSFLPSKEQMQDGMLLNRMKLCAFAIFLLWGSSLRTAVFIGSFVIEVPSTDLIFQSCGSAFFLARNEKEKFKVCVDTQLERCQADLEGAVNHEVDRVKALADQNAALVQYVNRLSTECSQDYINTRASMDGWLGKLHSLPFNNETCSAAEQVELSNTLGDVSLFQEEAMLLTKSYINSGVNSIHSIIDYVKTREDYDREYIMNHTKVISRELKKYFQMTRPGLPNGIFPNIPIQAFKSQAEYLYDVVFIQAMSCFTLDRALQKHCKLYPDWDLTLNTTFLEYLNSNVANKSIEMLYDFGDYYNRKINELNATRQKWNSIKEVVVDVLERVNNTIIPDFGLAFPGISQMNNNLRFFFPGFHFTPDIATFMHLQDEWNAIYEGISTPFSKFNPNVYEKYINETVMSKLFTWKFRLIQEADKLNELSWRWHRCMELKIGRLTDKRAIDADNNIYPEDYSPPPYQGSVSSVTSLDDELRLFETKNEVSRAKTYLRYN